MKAGGYVEEGSYNESDHYEKVCPQLNASGNDPKDFNEQSQKSINNGGSSSQGEEEKQD